jgi:hypothetical protein
MLNNDDDADSMIDHTEQYRVQGMEERAYPVMQPRKENQCQRNVLSSLASKELSAHRLASFR